MPNFEYLGGVVPVVVKDIASGSIRAVMMTDKICYLKTLQTGKCIFYTEVAREFEWTGQIVRYVSITNGREALIYTVETMQRWVGLTKIVTNLYEDTRSVTDVIYERDSKNQIYDIEVASWLTGRES